MSRFDFFARRPAAMLAATLAVGLATTGCSAWRVDRAARTATGFTSHVLCDEVFVTGIDAQRAFDERIRPLPGQAATVWALSHQVDAARREVSVTLAGGFRSRARHTADLGCVALPADEMAAFDAASPSPTPSLPPPLPPLRPLPPDPAGPSPIDAADPQLDVALRRAIPPVPDAHRTRAIVVMREGRIVAERYAAGFGVDTPMLGFSASKSVTNALIGILVHQGRLRIDAPGVLAAWQDPAAPQHAITVEHLLRHTSGLALVQDNSGFDTSSQIMYTVRDKAQAASAATMARAPGERWAYADTNYLLLSRVIRDAVGGHDGAAAGARSGVNAGANFGAPDSDSAARVRRFAQRELFAPLGMNGAQIDVDTTGTGIGASHVLARARDWARLGQLYLDDGVVDGRRILPEYWVRWSTTPTLDTGYGAGWWTNRREGLVPGWRAPWGLPQAPRDTFFARGYMGQFIVVVPSRRIVIVRLASAPQYGDDIVETDRIVAEVLQAIR